MAKTSDSYLIMVQPINNFFTFIFNCFPIFIKYLVSKCIIIHSILHVVCITFQNIPCLNFIPLLFILIPVLFCLSSHSLEIFFRQMALIIRGPYPKTLKFLQFTFIFLLTCILKNKLVYLYSIILSFKSLKQ